MAEDNSFSSTEQFTIYRSLKMLACNNLLQVPGNEELVKERIFLKIENNRITRSV